MFIDLQSHVAYVRTAGSPAAPPVVLLHSLGTSSAVWERQAAVLAESHYVISPDFRGHGYSGQGEQALTIDLLAADIVRIADALKLPTFCLAGISIGGLVAQAVAARLGSRIKALVLLDSSVATLNAQMWIDRAAQVRTAGLGSIADKVVKAWSSAAGQDSVDARGLRQILLSTSDEAYAAGCDALSTADCREAAASIRVPTWVAVGAEDAATPLPAAQALAAAIPAATLTVIPDAGHIPLFEQAAAVNALLAEAFRAA